MRKHKGNTLNGKPGRAAHEGVVALLLIGIYISRSAKRKTRYVLHLLYVLCIIDNVGL
jgi:hypothetical protein